MRRRRGSAGAWDFGPETPKPSAAFPRFPPGRPRSAAEVVLLFALVFSHPRSAEAHSPSPRSFFPAQPRFSRLSAPLPSAPAQNNPDLTGMEDPLEIWEHWVLLGQFQGRPHRFNCPVQLSASYRIAYLRARGDACFDHEFYLRHSPDLRGAQFKSTAEIFGHYAFYGQFEGRLTRFTCPDTMWDFASGFDSVEPTAPEEPKTAATAEHDGTSQAKP